MRPLLLAPLILSVLTGCAGDEAFTNVQDVVRLAIVDAGLNPPVPNALDTPAAFARTTGAAAVRVIAIAVPESRMEDDDHSSFWAEADTFALDRVGESDGITLWQTTLPRRGGDRGLFYFFEADGDDAVVARPEARTEAPLRVDADPFVPDFPRPVWPALRTPSVCAADRSRVYDGAEDEATLAPGVPFDVIRDARFVPWEQAIGLLANPDQVTRGLGVEVDGQAIFFPLIVMLFHETSNQRLGDAWTTMSYCPLTDSGLFFDTGLDPESLPRGHDYSPSGLFNSNLMIAILDQPLERRTLISQMLAYGVRGPGANQCVDPIPSLMVEFEIWRAMHPETLVLVGDPSLESRFDYRRRANPYRDYWNSSVEIRADVARLDDRLPTKARVLGVLDVDDPLAVVLGGNAFVHEDFVGEIPVAVLQARGTGIVLERVHPMSGEVFSLRRVDGSWGGMPLYEDDTDDPSIWSFEGIALRGPAAGQRLAWVPSMSAFWFAWYAHYPETRLVAPE